MSGALDRRGMIAKLHVAKSQIGMAETDYRAMLMRVAGVESSRVASDGQLLALLAEMRRLGFKDHRPVSDKPHVRKVWAVWRDMAPLLADGSDAALRSFCFRQVKLADPEWLDGHQANKVIEGLKAWSARLSAAKNEVRS
jgi:phage gp16-like protein